MEKNGDEVKPNELLTLHFFSFIEIHANQLDSGTYFEESWERDKRLMNIEGEEIYGF